jgi:F0F1-type ATP synthase membrane subunit b/b'
MQSFNQFVSNSLFFLIINIVVWKHIIKALNKSAPNVTSAAKTAAANKALSVIAKLFK